MNRLIPLAARLAFLVVAAAGIAVLGFDGPRTGTIMFSTFCVAVGLCTVTVVQIARHLMRPAPPISPARPQIDQTRRFIESSRATLDAPRPVGQTERLRRAIEADRAAAEERSQMARGRMTYYARYRRLEIVSASSTSEPVWLHSSDCPY